jgi:hypothetical protein
MKESPSLSGILEEKLRYVKFAFCMALACSTETGYPNADGNLLVPTRGKRCEAEIAALGMWRIRHSGVIYSQHCVLQQHGVGRKSSLFTETTNRKQVKQ